jgi:DNA (cytosine-5)-methyltransferase 1
MRVEQTRYYNDNDRHCAAWLRELVAAECIDRGEIDERSITSVQPADVAQFWQCHFFAGIGGWPLALRLAEWPIELPVWTGSCPCQPFSIAGSKRGTADERHLWPSWHRLIDECRPVLVIGEQVARALDWLDVVFDDLEGSGYTVGAADLCAASVGAPHARQRLFFVAYRNSARLEIQRIQQAWRQRKAAQRGGSTDELADTMRRGRRQGQLGTETGPTTWDGSAGELDNAGVERQQQHSKLDGRPAPGRDVPFRADLVGPSFWDRAQWIACTDGKSRPIEPGTRPLVDGIPGRVGLVRGYGNAIVPQVAQAFAECFLEADLP